MIEGANIVTDFSDGTDLIGLDNNLAFNELTIEQGVGEYINHTLIRITETGEYLLVLQNTIATEITELDFTDVNISESSRNAANKDSTDKEDSSIDPMPKVDDDPDGDYPVPDASELPDWSLLVEASLGSIALPETFTATVITAEPDLSDLVGLLGDQAESMALDFAQVDAENSLLANIEGIKPITLDWMSQTDPLIDSDWNPIMEELYYTSEFC